jgi:transcriptional regulator with XRE-family HTH domain
LRFYQLYASFGGMSMPFNASDSALLSDIGRRLAAWRLARNLTQSEVAERAGLGLRTVQRLESGEAATHLSGFLGVCRVLGLLDRIDALIPEPTVSPIAQLRLRRKERKRATRTPRERGSKKWSWNDET